METGKSSGADDGKKGVMVFMNDRDAMPQPSTFQLCPLGCQFYSDKPLDDFTLLEFNLQLPPDAATEPCCPCTCVGAVVKCQRDPAESRYRVWVKFVDLPEQAKNKIRCEARKGQHLCCYCENF